MPTLRFTVDSALLRELGERLVGKAHIALAELIKNSYDADAKNVLVSFGEDTIEVLDNGYGMDYDAFKNFWMRIGTTHKTEDQTSPKFKRPLTGSKGVGRLAVQFLGDRVQIRTTARQNPDEELVAEVDWTESVKAGELTEAKAHYKIATREKKFADNSKYGTQITVSGLKQVWGSHDFEELAKELWTLQPPFGVSKSGATDTFSISLNTPNAPQAAAFEQQMRAVHSLWYAKIFGRLQRSGSTSAKKAASVTAEILIQFADGGEKRYDYSIENPLLHSVEFEILVFHLVRRQRHGIKVQDARDYIDRFGGVRVYDSGFHLPYYGSKEADWLETEQDHAHRLSASQLLPEALQVSHGMNYLPTRSRILGGVQVNTSLEARKASGRDCLTIQVTRDRLVSNESYHQLKSFVRYAMDLYAMEEAKRAFSEEANSAEIEPLTATVQNLEDVLERYRDEIPSDVFEPLSTQVAKAVRVSEAQERETQAHLGLLGTLATAGIAALGYQHELNKQIRVLASIRRRLLGLASKPGADPELKLVATEIDTWIHRAGQTQALFLPLLDEEDRETRSRPKLRAFLEHLVGGLSPFLRGIEVDLTGAESDLRLPPGTLAEWSAIFQNVFINAANAMLDSPRRRLSVTDSHSGRRRRILILDTGVGVDLSTADELFEPFVRKLKTTEERKKLALGGTGLGLTIVRMIARQLGCKVSFVSPPEGFNTAFCLEWREST